MSISPTVVADLMRCRNKLVHGRQLSVHDRSFLAGLSYHLRSAHHAVAGHAIATFADETRAGGLRRTAAAAWARVPSYPRVWGLLRYLLGQKARREVFEPSYEELLADYYTGMSENRDSAAARVLLRVFFAIRTILMLVNCYWVAGLDRLPWQWLWPG